MNKLIRILALALLAPAAAAAVAPGDRVLATWQDGDYVFPGRVASVSEGRVVVEFEDGTRDTRPADEVRPFDWGVGSAVSCRWAGGEDWYAGRITALRADGTTLHVTYDDGDQEETRTALCRSRHVRATKT